MPEAYFLLQFKMEIFGYFKARVSQQKIIICWLKKKKLKVKKLEKRMLRKIGKCVQILFTFQIHFALFSPSCI